MRIFFTGAQGTGKSTLVNQISREIIGYDKYDSMSRFFMNKKEDQQTDDFQKKISLFCLNIYVNQSNFVSSRSFFDSIAYPTYSDHFDMVSMVRNYEDMLFEKDCLYFYLPIEFSISNGGNDLRMTDIDYQKKIDLLISHEIESQKLKGNLVEGDNFFILRGSVEERLTKIREVLKSKGVELYD